MPYIVPEEGINIDLERDIDLSDSSKEYYEVRAVAWYIIRDQDTGKIAIKENLGYVVFERDPVPPHDTTAFFVPDIFHRDLVSLIHRDVVRDPTATKAPYTMEVPQRRYLGFGRVVPVKPEEVGWGSVWTDQVSDSGVPDTNARHRCILNFIHQQEDYMLDGKRPENEIEDVITCLGEYL